MLTKSHRFHGHNSLNFVYRNGKTFRGQNISLKISENSRRKTYRLAVVVAKKVSKSAVTRNRIRRRIFEVVRLSSSQITKPYDMVITVFQPNIASIPINKLSDDINHLLVESGATASTTNSSLKSRAIIDEKEN